MKLEKLRSYQKVVDRIKKAASQSKECTLTPLGEIKSDNTSYPIYSLRISSKHTSQVRKRQVSLSAGIHGDEPAGVEAVLTLLENPDLYERFLRDIDFTIFPCINPSGYERNTRTNHQGFDLNRKFDRKRPPKEVDLLRQVLAGKTVDLSMEFHEDVDTHGFYLYEVKKEGPYFGEAIVREVSTLCPINARDEIEGLPSSGGIIRPSIERILSFRKKDWPQAIYHIRNGARHCITCETPITLPIEERARVHLIALDTALRHLIQAH